MSPKEERLRNQTLAWAQGRPYHEAIDDTCCLDFSCCRPELFTKDAAERWRIYHENFGSRH